MSSRNEAHTTGGATRDLPKNIEAEQAVLGSAMLEPEGTVPTLLEMLKPEHLYRQGHRVIFHAIRDLFDRGEPADIVSVANLLEEKEEMDKAGGRVYLNELLDRVTTTTSLEYYADIVRKKAMLRALIEAGGRISELGYATNEETQSLLERAKGILVGVNGSGGVSNALRRTFQPKSILQLRREGLPTRDDIIEGVLPRGGILQILAPPKKGKTLLALNLALAVLRGAPFLHWPTQRANVLYLTGEGGVQLVDERLMKMVLDDTPGLERLFVWAPEPGQLTLQLDDALVRQAIVAYSLLNQVGLIIIDPLCLFHGLDENSTSEMRDLVLGLLGLGRQTGAGLSLIHHTRKLGGASRRGSPQEGRGSSVIHGAVDASFVLEPRGGGQAVLHAELRWAPSPAPVLLKCDAETLLYKQVGELIHGNRKLSPEVLFSILQEHGPKNIRQLQTITNCGDRTVRTNLRELKEQGLATFDSGRSGQKLWRVVEEVAVVPF